MPNLVFKAADVRRVVEHSIAAPKQGEQAVDFDAKTGQMVMAPVPSPAVLLVHDDGVYLMSNGEPGDALDPTKAGEPCFRRYVAYAEGCDPVKDADSWDTSRALVGGDDFGETLPWASDIKRGIDEGASHVVIRFGGNKIGLSFRGVKRKAVA